MKQATTPNLWAVVVSHSEVPGDHLILMYQPTEPTDEEVHTKLIEQGHDDDLDSITVTHAFDLVHWMKHYDNKRALSAFIAAGGMNS